MTRTIYGADDIYTRMALDSLEDWRWLSSRAGLPVFYPIRRWEAKSALVFLMPSLGLHCALAKRLMPAVGRLN